MSKRGGDWLCNPVVEWSEMATAFESQRTAECLDSCSSEQSQVLDSKALVLLSTRKRGSIVEVELK